MKKLAFILLGNLLSFFSAFAQQQPAETPVSSQISQVTVFLQGAQIHRKAGVSLNQGKSILVLSGLSPYIDPNSIKAGIDGGATILSVNHRRDFMAERRQTEEAQALTDRLTLLQDSIQYQKALESTLEEEENLLKANQQIAGQQTGLDFDNLKAIAGYYTERRRAIKLERLAIQKRLERYAREQQKIRNQQQELQNNPALFSSQVVVAVSAEKAAKVQLDLSYFSGGAGWVPQYDLRVKTVAEPVEFVYKAQVSQRTGEDWNNIRMRFSNADPNRSGALPNLEPYYLRFQQHIALALSGAVRGISAYDLAPGRVSGVITDDQGEPLVGASVLFKGTTTGTVTDVDGRYSLSVPPGATTLVVSYTGFTIQELPLSGPRMDVMLSSAAMLEEVAVTSAARPKAARREEKKADEPAQATTTLEYQTSIEFELDHPFTVPSNGEQYTLELKRHQIPAYYEYRSVPKLEKAAFLTARITGWEKYNILEGQANLFFEDTYLGQTLLDPRNAADTLDLSLGQDRGIAVDRQPQGDFARKNLSGAKRIETRSYKIVVRNNKSQPVNLVLFDQIPVSTNKDIEIETLEVSGAALEKASGRLKWALSLKPNQQQELTLSYSVKYPQGETVNIE